MPRQALASGQERPALQSIGLHPTADWLNIEQAAAHLRLSIEDFNYYRLLNRIPAPLNGEFWSRASLVLRSRAPDKERLYGIYVIQFMEFIKIGFSSHLYHRLASLQTGLPLRMKVHKVIEGPGRARERQLHHRFATYRTQGEWYRHEGRLALWIEAGCK